MAKVYFILAFVIQASIIYANNVNETDSDGISREVLKNKPDIEEELDPVEGHKEWMDTFFMPVPNGMFPSSSAALMSSVTSSDKTTEEQLEDIKDMSSKITLAIQSELANLLSYALAHCDKDTEGEANENTLRKKRETPMDSSQLIMRLLKHIKSNNEYQNIAIEKMMSAQEIADKFGIDYTPDADVLSDLAVAANDQAKEMTSILTDAIKMNSTKPIPKEEVQFVPVEKTQNLPEQVKCQDIPQENDTYYVYSMHPDPEMYVQQPFPAYEYTPEHYAHSPAVNHGQYQHHYDHHHYENPKQYHAPPPPPPVTPKPNFYDSIMAYTPDPYVYTCPVEPITTTTTIILPIEEFVEPEPELIGEEYEETISSKLFVNRDEEPGSATVNHVMTYTISEKAHFKKPEIEKLPEQMQYTFFLM